MNFEVEKNPKKEFKVIQCNSFDCDQKVVKKYKDPERVIEFLLSTLNEVLNGDLEEVQTIDLVNELKSRFESFIFCGENSNGKALLIQEHEGYKGNKTYCMGMCQELSHKILTTDEIEE